VAVGEIDDNFLGFARELERNIARYGVPARGGAAKLRKQQVEELIRLEAEWRDTLLSSSLGIPTYEAFVRHVTKKLKNVLKARPFFRERHTTFTKEISKALKAEDAEAVSKFRVNWLFIDHVMRRRRWGRKLVALAKRVQDLRTELAVRNLPLDVSRARMFWSRTPESHLSFLDLVQLGAIGLLAGIDKYAAETYEPVWASVAIGRMSGEFIDGYNQTLLHFYPSDQRRLYRAHKFLARHPDGGVDPAALLRFVNHKVKRQHRVTLEELYALLAAASTTSSDALAAAPPKERPGAPSAVRAWDEGPEEGRPDVQYERMDLTRKLALAARGLTMIEWKLLRLKGVRVPWRAE
jgi:hypothetical protein